MALKCVYFTDQDFKIFLLELLTSLWQTTTLSESEIDAQLNWSDAYLSGSDTHFDSSDACFNSSIPI